MNERTSDPRLPDLTRVLHAVNGELLQYSSAFLEQVLLTGIESFSITKVDGGTRMRYTLTVRPTTERTTPAYLREDKTFHISLFSAGPRAIEGELIRAIEGTLLDYWQRRSEKEQPNTNRGAPPVGANDADYYMAFAANLDQGKGTPRSCFLKAMSNLTIEPATAGWAPDHHRLVNYVLHMASGTRVRCQHVLPWADREVNAVKILHAVEADVILYLMEAPSSEVRTWRFWLSRRSQRAQMEAPSSEERKRRIACGLQMEDLGKPLVANKNGDIFPVQYDENGALAKKEVPHYFPPPNSYLGKVVLKPLYEESPQKDTGENTGIDSTVLDNARVHVQLRLDKHYHSWSHTHERVSLFDVRVINTGDLVRVEVTSREYQNKLREGVHGVRPLYAIEDITRVVDPTQNAEITGCQLGAALWRRLKPELLRVCPPHRAPLLPDPDTTYKSLFRTRHCKVCGHGRGCWHKPEEG